MLDIAHTRTPVLLYSIIFLSFIILLNGQEEAPMTRCRDCETAIPANCTGIETNNTLLCSAQQSKCPLQNCSGQAHCSYTFIGLRPANSSTLVWTFTSGCIKDPPPSECVPASHSLHLDRLVCFSDCSGSNCSDIDLSITYNISDLFTDPTPAETTPTSAESPGNDSVHTIIVVVVFVVVVMVIIVIIVLVCCCKLRPKFHTWNRERPPRSSFMNPVNAPLSWKRKEPIGHGRYGSVYKAEYLGRLIAVKIFMSNAQTWETERNLYCMESTAHKNLLEYIASEVRGSGISMERVLLTRFYPHGSLNSYLRTHIVTWQVACEMIQSVSEGLTHLHSNYYTNSVGIVAEKYPIAHRDIKSANVLVRSERGDCVISDLGFALILDGKQTSNTVQAGTYRYMSPEALDARVNLQDLLSFKQIDVYAFSLVMWEVMSRTCVLSEEDVPSYKLPYEEEVGLRPSLDLLKDIVVTRKLRPSLPAIWGNHTHLSFLLETLHECWDDDAEARLSAANVTIRMQQLALTNIDDITRQDSLTMTTVSSSILPESNPVIDMDRPTEHSQSSPPPYYSPTDPSPFLQTAFPFSGGPIQRHQVSMPHIYPLRDTEQRAGNGHMVARCTRSLRSSRHYEQEMVQLNSSNRSESLILRNTFVLGSRAPSNVDEIIRELSQSPPGYPLLEENERERSPERIVTGGFGRDDGSLDGREVGSGIEFLHPDISELASNSNSDSGILNTNSELSHFNETAKTLCRDATSDSHSLCDSEPNEQ